MNDVLIVDSRRIAEFMLAAITVGTVVLLVLETVYLVIFTVFVPLSILPSPGA